MHPIRRALNAIKRLSPRRCARCGRFVSRLFQPDQGKYTSFCPNCAKWRGLTDS